MAYSAPVLNPSGMTWAQLQGLGAQGLVQTLVAVNHCNADVTSRLAGGQKSVGEAFAAYVSLVDHYITGDPVEATDFAARLTNLATVFHVLAAACDEINTLIDAHPGTLKTVPHVGSGHPVKRRVFP